MIAAGADVNAVDSNGNSVLIHSVYARDDEYCVNSLVQAGADVNNCHGGIRVLMAAAIQGHINCVRALIKAAADVNGKDNNRNTNHRNNVERVTNGGSDGEEEMDATPLILTARCVKPRCMEALIEAGADVNLTNEEGCTALLVASNSKGNLKDIYTCMKLLIDAKADVNAIDKNGNTALLFTVSKTQNISEEDAESAHENKKLLDLLLQSGATVNLANHKNITPLILAASFCQPNYVEDLIRAGADVNLANADGEPALLTLAKSIGKDKDTRTCIQSLIKVGAHVNATDRNKNTSLMYLAERGLNFSVDTLINAGADVNLCNSTGQTALIKASGNGHVKSMNSIIMAGADANGSDHAGVTATMYAATKGHDS